MGLFNTRQPDPELPQRALRPAPLPSVVTVRAPEDASAQSAAKNLDALARALGMLNNSVNEYANVNEHLRQDPQSKANKEWIAKRSQYSFDELKKEAESNSADGIRIREDAITALLGEKAYSQFRSDWAQYYANEFDHQNGDMNADYEEKRKEFAETLPDEISRGRFYQLTQNHLAAWQQENTKEKIEEAQENVQTAVLDAFRNTIADGKNEGKSAEEISKQLFEASAANRSFLRFTGQQQNATMFQIAQEAAQNGDLELVKAIVEAPRVGAKGEKIPPLKNIAAFASKSLKLIEAAQSSKLSKNSEENTRAYMALDDKVASGELSEEDAVQAQKSGLWTSQQAAAHRQQSLNNLARIEASAKKQQQVFEAKNVHLRAQDELVTSTLSSLDKVSGATYIGDAEIPNEKGTGTVTISREKRIKMAVDAKEQQFNDYTQRLIDNGIDPEDAKKEGDKVRIAWYSNNNIENKAWSDIFNGAASRMTVENLTKNESITKVLTQQLETYHSLKSQNPAYLDRFITDKKSKEFLNYFDNAVNYGQLPVHDAAIAAANWVAKDDLEKSSSILKSDKVDKLTRKVLSAADLDKDTSLNVSLVKNLVTEQSRLGVPESRIEDIVSNQIKNDTVQINGVLVKKTKELPDDFAPLMLKSLDEISSKISPAKGSITPDDMIVLPSPNEGMWTVHEKSNPLRVLAIITPENLQNIRKKDLQEREEILKEKASLLTEDSDYIKSQLPALEARRAKYVAGEQAMIKRLRSQSKEAGDYYSQHADTIENNLNDWIAKDNAAALRGHKISKFFSKTIPQYATDNLLFSSGKLQTPTEEKQEQKRNENPKSIIGLYGRD